MAENLYRRIKSILSIAFLALLPSCSVVETGGWQTTRWGMTQNDVKRALRGQRYNLQFWSDGSINSDNLPLDFDTKIYFFDSGLSGHQRLITFNFEEKTGLLYKVKVFSMGENDEFIGLILAGLLRKYGNTQDKYKEEPRQGGVTYRWQSGRTIVSFIKTNRDEKDPSSWASFIIEYSRGPRSIVGKL